MICHRMDIVLLISAFAFSNLYVIYINEMLLEGQIEDRIYIVTSVTFAKLIPHVDICVDQWNHEQHIPKIIQCLLLK